MSFDLQLNGLRAVVTGGTMGLGAAVVQNLVEGGARVATSARDVSARPVEGVTYIRADLTTPARCGSPCTVRSPGLGGC
jgi:NAD(P)-dependent dehydrogenase (short-subunit alcohol dehydrogenase family)